MTEKCDPLIGNLTLLFAVLLQLGSAAAGSGMLERVISDTNFQDTFQNERQIREREREIVRVNWLWVDNRPPLC